MKKLILMLFVVSVSLAFFRWDVDVRVRSGENITTLTFGADSFATDGYDPYLDVPFFPPPGGGYGYFGLDDELFPAYTMLCVDYRTPSSEEMTWDLRLGGGSNFVISWSPSQIPDSGEYRIGAFEIDSLPELIVVDWFDMRETDSISIFFLGGEIRATEAPVWAIQEGTFILPESMTISAFPNPFNSTLSIEVEGGGSSVRSIEIFDISGILVKKIYGNHLELGDVQLEKKRDKFLWTPHDGLSSGVYLIRAFNGQEQMSSKRVIYLK